MNTKEQDAVLKKITDLSSNLMVLEQGLGADLFALASEHTETWSRMPDSLWDLANDLRRLARDAYSIAVECDKVTEEIQPKCVTYKEHKAKEEWFNRLLKELEEDEK